MLLSLFTSIFFFRCCFAFALVVRYCFPSGGDQVRPVKGRGEPQDRGGGHGKGGGGKTMTIGWLSHQVSGWYVFSVRLLFICRMKFWLFLKVFFQAPIHFLQSFQTDNVEQWWFSRSWKMGCFSTSSALSCSITRWWKTLRRWWNPILGQREEAQPVREGNSILCTLNKDGNPYLMQHHSPCH